MTDEEKQALAVFLMEDIRGNWGWDLRRRIDLLLSVATELNNSCLMGAINEFISLCDEGDDDGRYFRQAWPHGYENLPFEINRSIKSYSREFQEIARSYLTYPESRFEDYKE